MTTTATQDRPSKLPPNPRPIRAEPALIDAIAVELRAYKGRDLERAQEAVQEVLQSRFQGSWEALLARFRDAIKAKLRGRWREPTGRPVTDADRAKLPTRGGAIRLAPEIAAALEELLEPLAGVDLERARAAILKVYGSGVQGSFDQVLDAYRQAVAGAVGRSLEV